MVCRFISMEKSSISLSFSLSLFSPLLSWFHLPYICWLCICIPLALQDPIQDFKSQFILIAKTILMRTQILSQSRGTGTAPESATGPCALLSAWSSPGVRPRSMAAEISNPFQEHGDVLLAMSLALSPPLQNSFNHFTSQNLNSQPFLLMCVPHPFRITYYLEFQSYFWSMEMFLFNLSQLYHLVLF